MIRKNKKELISNIISLGSVDILGMLIPIITMPLITRAIGLELYGQYLLFITTITFGHTIIDYGVQYTGVRSVAQCRDDNEAVKNHYESYQGLRFILALSYFFVISIYTVNAFSSYAYIAPLFLYLSGYFLTSAWFFHGIALTKYLSIASIFNKLILLLFIIYFVRDENDFLYLIFFSTLPVFITSIFLYVFIRGKYMVKLFGFSRLRELFNNGKSVFIGLLAPNLYNALPVMILGNYAEKLEFATFAISLKVCSVVFMLQNVVARSIYPIATREKLKNDSLFSTLTLNLFFVIPSVVVLYFIGIDLIHIVLSVQMSTDIYIKIVSFSLIFVAISNSFVVGYFLPRGYDKQYRDVSLQSSLLSAVIVFFMIYNYSVLGGAIGLLLSRAILVFNYCLKYKKIKNEKIS